MLMLCRWWWGFGDADDQMLAILNQSETPTTAGVVWAKHSAATDEIDDDDDDDDNGDDDDDDDIGIESGRDANNSGGGLSKNILLPLAE